VAPSPARSVSVDSRASSECSISSRLSELSQPRVLSKGLLSSEDLELHRAAQERRALRKQMRRNERSMKQAILHAEVSSGLTQRNIERILTLPKGPELRTSSRSARVRSTSWHGESLLSSRSHDDGNFWGGLRQHPIAREQAAIEKHLSRAVAAASEKLAGSVAPQALASKKPTDQEATDDMKKWIKEGATAEERAERARQAAMAQQDSNLAQERSKLFVFKSKPEKTEYKATT